MTQQSEWKVVERTYHHLDNGGEMQIDICDDGVMRVYVNPIVADLLNGIDKIIPQSSEPYDPNR